MTSGSEGGPTRTPSSGLAKVRAIRPHLPAQEAPTDVVLLRWPIDPGVHVGTLRRAWRNVLDAWGSLPGAAFPGEGRWGPRIPGALCVVRFPTGDEQAHRLMLESFRGPASIQDRCPPVRAVLLQVGERTEFVVCADRSALPDPLRADLFEQLLAAYRVVEADGTGIGAADRRWARTSGTSVAPTPSIHAIQVARTPHLHLIHPGGGRATVYRPLAAQLPGGWTVTGSDDTGRGDSVETLAAIYLRELLPAAGLPDLLGGWSLGGMIAFQMARLLLAAGHPPPALLLLDTPPPGSSGAMPDLARINLEFAGMLWASIGLAEEYLPETLEVDDDETAMRMLATALRIAGEPIEVELLLEQFDAYCRHRAALTSYAPVKGLATRALVITTSADHTAQAWRRLLLVEPVVAALPGGHYDTLAPQHLPEVARLITSFVGS